MALKNDDLFILIKSLSPSEKKFVAASFKDKSKSKPIYLKLFNWINKQAVYDERKLKTYLGKTGQSKQLAYLKNYLYKHILEKLFTLEEDFSVELRIDKMIHQAKILHDKRLYDQSNDLLSKAKHLAEINEYKTGLIRIQSIQTLIYRVQYGKAELLELGQQTYDEILHQIRLIENEYNYELLSFLFSNTYVSNYRARNESEQNKFAAILDSHLMQSESEALTVNSKIKYHNILAIDGLRRQQHEQFYEHTKAVYACFEENERQVVNRFQNYIGASYNYSKSLVFTNRLSEYDELLSNFQATIERHKKLVRSDRMKSYLYGIKSMMEFTYFITTKEIDKFYQNQFQEIVGKYDVLQQGVRKNTKIHILHNITLIYFLMEDYNQCLVWNNKILEEYDDSYYSRWLLIAKIKSLMLHYELNNLAYLPYAIRSTYRYLLKLNSQLEFEKRILQFLKSVQRFVSKKDLQHAFEVLLEDLQRIAKLPQEDATCDFPYIIWLEHKCQPNKNLLELYVGK